MKTAGPSRSLSVGDDCPDCGREITETTGGGLLAYCWWCNVRNSDTETNRNREEAGGGHDGR